MMYYLTLALRFLFLSSKDPKRTSLFVRSALLALIPYVLHATEAVCKWGYQCMYINASSLEVVVETIVASVFYTFSLISAIGMMYGALRKLDRTARGINRAIE